MPETPPWSGMGSGDHDDKLLQQALRLLEARRACPPASSSGSSGSGFRAQRA